MEDSHGISLSAVASRSLAAPGNADRVLLAILLIFNTPACTHKSDHPPNSTVQVGDGTEKGSEGINKKSLCYAV